MEGFGADTKASLTVTKVLHGQGEDATTNQTKQDTTMNTLPKTMFNVNDRWKGCLQDTYDASTLLVLQGTTIFSLSSTLVEA